MSSLSSSLREVGFVVHEGGVFTQPLAHGVHGWVSIAGNAYSMMPLIGIVLSDVNRLARSCLERAFPDDKADLYLHPVTGPPLLLVRLRDLMLPDQGQSVQAVFPWEFDGGAPISSDATNSMVQAILRYSSAFFAANCSTGAVLNSALRLSPGGQAQIYLIPAAAVQLGDLSLLREYGENVLKTLTETEIHEGYNWYLECLQHRCIQN